MAFGCIFLLFTMTVVIEPMPFSNPIEIRVRKCAIIGLGFKGCRYSLTDGGSLETEPVQCWVLGTQISSGLAGPNHFGESLSLGASLLISNLVAYKWDEDGTKIDSV